MKRFRINFMGSIKSAIALFAMVFFSHGFANNDEAKISSLLAQLESAQLTLNYTATLVSLHNDDMNIVDVEQYSKDGQYYQSIFSLNGEERKVVKHNDELFCYLPDKLAVVADQKNVSFNHTSDYSALTDEATKQHYDFVLGPKMRVSNREAVVLIITPKDQLRYEHQLWIDSESGLLLKSMIIDANRNIVEHDQLINVKLLSADEVTLPTLKSMPDLWQKMQVKLAGAVDDQVKLNCHIPELLSGFSMTSMQAKANIMPDSEMMQHFNYSDGLSSLSVFVEPFTGDHNDQPMMTSMGGIHVYKKHQDGYRITVMANAPAQTAQLFADNIDCLQ